MSSWVDLAGRPGGPGRFPASGAGNPSLDYVPEWEGFAATMDRLTVTPERLPDGRMESDGTANYATEEQARLILAITDAMRHSTLERNPADFEYQRLLMAASRLLADVDDAHGHSNDAWPLAVPNAGARGIFVSIPAGMGQHTLVNAIERYVGTDAPTFRVATRRGAATVNKVKSLTVPFPADGRPKTFVAKLLRKLDAAIGTGFAAENSGPFHRYPRECALALAAVGIQQNLGILIVPFITSKAVSQPEAGMLLAELSQFALLTGILVLCIGSPGAASALIEHGEAVAPLFSKGGFSITSLQRTAPQWGLWCVYLWDNYFSYVYGVERPSWFEGRLWDNTCGLTDYVTKLARYVYQKHEQPSSTPLTPELLDELAGQALVLEAKPLAALRHVANRGPTSRDGARRYADWLPLEVSLLAIPTVDQSYDSTVVLPLMGEVS